ncbi:MAG: RluA family pseudouridine synthase [Pseudobacteriovorax sp.]|nr:RluA family pseudouridine synthase [Pseudobacteriovorax sp.]
MESLKLQLDDTNHKRRLDQTIAEMCPGLSRRKIRDIIGLGGCYINRKRVRKNAKLLSPGDVIELAWWDDEITRLRKTPSLISKDSILYEDSEIVAINKPGQLPSQETKTQAVFHVAAQLNEFYKSQNETTKARLVHRLDRDTTGVMVLAKTKSAYSKLSNLFAKGTLTKVYHGITSGALDTEDNHWTISCPLGPIRPSQGRVYPDPKRGKKAETEVTTIRNNDNYQLIEAIPKTGRTHQIRAHLESIDLPLINDDHYGGERVPRLTGKKFFLHARSLTIPYWKTNRSLIIQAPYPNHFDEAIESLNL